MQVYLRDLVEDRTTLVADEPILGHVWCGDPDWSHDGTKILFDASTDDRDDPAQRTRSRLMVLERRDGQPRMRDLGPGLCGKFSPDDRRIVFALNPADARDQAGIWVMKTDGTDRTRLITDVYGAPSWSDDRRQLLINTFNDPARSYVYDFPTRQTTQVVVPGQTIFSWPRWAGPHTLVASLGAGNEPVAIDLLDILRPGQAAVEPALEAERRARHLRAMAALRALDRGLLLPRSPGRDAGDLEGIGRPGKAGGGLHRRRGAAQPYGGAERLSGRPVPGLQRRSARPGGGRSSPVAGSGRPSIARVGPRTRLRPSGLPLAGWRLDRL